MLTALRREAQEALLDAPAARKPALRRSDDPEALLATDLPLIADSGAVEALTARMAGSGWRVRRAGDWLLLDKDVPAPSCAVPDRLEGEPGACVSLLMRHPQGGADKATVRAVAKAAESGYPALERLCARLHAAWAEALREHRDLPGGLLPYLCRAIDMTQGGNAT